MLNRPQTPQKHKKSPPHKSVEQDELFYCISVHFGDNLKFPMYSFIWQFPIAWATCDLTQVCLFVCICSCYTDDSLCGLPGIKTIQTCTPTTKPICGKCETGKYFSKVVDGCMPCSPPCTALQTEVQSCSHEHNRVCQPRPPSTPGGIITLTHSRLIPLSTQGLSSVCISNSKNIPTRNNINVQ